MNRPILTLVLSALHAIAHAQTSAPPPPAWPPPESGFRRVVLDEDALVDGVRKDTLDNPMELAVAPDGRVFWVELTGTIKQWSPSTRTSKTIGQVDVFHGRAKGFEDGLLGIALDPKFPENGWIYLNHSIPGTIQDAHGLKGGIIRVARYTLQGDQLDTAHPVRIIDIETQRVTCCHVGGSLAFDARGNLYISVGDNTNPFDSDGFAPIDDRPGHEPWDARRSAGNANALAGKILRIKPRPDGGYDIPDGNLFKPGTAGTRPEIYVMGNRNPFRISIDRRTGYLYWGEVGPDASTPNERRGPAGFDEINQARAAGNFGWPFFVADNKPYVAIDFVQRQAWLDQKVAYDKAVKAAAGQPVDVPKPAPWPAADAEIVRFDPAHPVNRSRNNTGIRDLPPAQPAFIYYPASPSTRFPVVGSGGRTAMAGPVYHFDPRLESPTKLPASLDHTLFIYEWTRNWIIAVKLDANDRIEKMQRFMPSTDFKRPMDLELGPDGCLYLIEYGKDWGGNLDSRIVRIEAVPSNSQAP